MQRTAPHTRRGGSRRDSNVETGGHRIDVLGCPVDALDLSETLERCLDLAREGRGRQVSINAWKIALCSRDAELRDVVRGAEIVSADGVPVLWAARLLGEPLPGRVNGTDLMYELMRAGSARGLRVFILGSREEVLAAAVRRIHTDYPGLVVAGTHHGYFSPRDERAVVEAIRGSGCELLFVAMSSPLKELWLDRNWDELGVPFAMGVGGSIDVFAGFSSRAPRWMQRAGLEWLFRLVTSPRGRWRPTIVGNARFLLLLGRELAGRRYRKRPT
jgi:N-acetylglucosaminyldiphosphoundecaprenol N-acetyl-beta-D-mannosaminyltransferase